VHAAIGASAPVGLVVTQHASILQGFTMAAVSAGFALLPDLDHPQATASKALGPPAHHVVHGLCRAVVQVSATRDDRSTISYRQIQKHDPYHRTLTHTLAASLAVGALAYLLARTLPMGAGAVAAFGVLMLWPLYRKTVGLVVLGAAAAAAGATLLLNPWLLSIAVTGGYVSHVVADGCTSLGVPALWPLKIKGKRWWNIRLLDSAVKSGSFQEKGPAIGVAMASNALLVLLTL
jgi:membrane-bound metal-dependent hydrolase YbcI (DUF457 family)